MARILLVDDDSDVLELGRALLAHAGHEAFTAESALDALNFLEDTRVDLLITDVNMPMHSGFDLVRYVKDDPRHAQMTIAVLTGRRERKDIEKALSLGVHDYIVKPLDPELLLKKIADLLQRRPPQQTENEEFASLRMNASAKASVGIHVVSISELGLVIRSPHPFTAGTRIELETDLFQKIGIEHPVLRISASYERPGGWEAKVSFVGAEEKMLTKIRAWVFANTLRNRVA